MVRRRSVDFLPEIFRTSQNKKFLSATLDQLTQEPIYSKISGYVGRQIGPGVNPNDVYVTEPSKVRTSYQLEPGVTFFKPDTTTPEDAITYPGMLDALDLLGADTTRQDRLWQSQYYSWDPFCDLDKFNNYSQYYWLPQGPDPVDISETIVPLTDDFTVTRSDTSYTFTGYASADPVITLVRGGQYTFDVNQIGNNFWIQAALDTPGQPRGTMPGRPNISSRDVFGVSNNGEDQGTVTFNVPRSQDQDFYYNLTDLGSVDLICNLQFAQINNIYVSTFLERFPKGIDGITNLQNRTLVFTNTVTDPQDGGWQVTSFYDPLFIDNGNGGRSVLTDNKNGFIGSYDTTLFDQTVDLPQSDYYKVWQIQYVYDESGKNPYMSLTPILDVPDLSKFNVRFGQQWSGTSWYKNQTGFFEEIPLLTATLDTLYYQDGTNPEIFGRFRLVDVDPNTGIPAFDVGSIIGAKNYIAPNGVVFTNGLKVQFRGLVEPARFQNASFYVEGVGTGPGIDARVGFVDGEAYFGPWHYVKGSRPRIKMTGSKDDPTVFQQYIYDTLEESIANYGAGGPEGAPLPSQGQIGALVGNGIKLIPVASLITPETYTKNQNVPYDSTAYDVEPYDAALNAPQTPDYLTINRASRDLNPWTRSNRWFHKDVIQAAAEYNNNVVSLDNNFRAKRPIIEFRANLNLYNFGTQGKIPVNIVDIQTTDALSQINGQLGYTVDGYPFIQGSRVIFAADEDLQVRNRVYTVNFIDPDGSGNLVIDLEPIFNDGEALINQTVVCLSGTTLQGINFWFDGAVWRRGQQKTGVNQPPLFDVFDSAGRSFGDKTVYPSSTFEGSKLFSYALGTTSIRDEVLGFPLRYLNINNVGDIVFENNLYSDTFLYVRDNQSITVDISSGFVKEYIDRVTYTNTIGWQTAASEGRSRQVFRFNYDGVSLVLDVPADTSSIFAPVQVYVQGVFVDPTKYTYTITETQTIITFNDSIEVGTIIEVQVLSNVASEVAYYQVPANLQNNPFNENSTIFSLGSIRTHYETIGQNLRTLVGPINGANNTRDLGDIIRYGTSIIQNSSPLTLGGVFLRRQQFEVSQSIQFNSIEYQNYKSLLLDLAGKGDYINDTPTQVLDKVIQEISLGRSNVSPFYWSDMLPSGDTYIENTYTYTNISTPTFDTVQVYDFTSSNFLGLSVYLNGTLLLRGYEYTVSVDAPTLTITTALTVGDIIQIREYPSTYGSYVPNTPSKMGLYPAYKPEVYLDETYVTPRYVIVGHDGSKTIAFGDYRDQVLLEFEKRIFNNLKIVSQIPLTATDVIPGQFRTTDYSLSEINRILSTDFLSWVGFNKLDYSSQVFIADDPFTYNYSQSSNRIDGQPLLGAWRGIYNYFYDTTSPNTTPWEMLGFTQEPDWWENYYGPAPYTSGNNVLWEDLAAGLVRDPNGSYYLPQYARPDLLKVVPSGSEGALLDPLYSTVGNYDATSFRRSWAFGDDGPVESAWRTSSAWPFAMMRLLLLTKPAKFFGLFADRDNYVFDPNIGQFLWQGRYRLDAKKLSPLYGDGVSKASYINWIIDFNRQLGINSTENLTTALDNIGVRLMWRMAGYSDKRLLKIYSERSSPNSNNSSLLLPDESYQILLYKDQPFEQIRYSSVIIQSTDDGWQVLGYSSTKPYFEILASRPNGTFNVISAGGTTVRVNLEYTNNVVQVPYGFVFSNVTAVCDFLLSYGELLKQQGLVFENRENGYILDWQQMAQEFLYWSAQGWATGSIINLNPAATSISISRPQAVVDNISQPSPESIVLNQNRQPLSTKDLVIDRIGNDFTITSLTSDTINYINLKFTSYEHLVIVDNVSIFADLIYDPMTGARQTRLLVSGIRSGDWTGLVDAPGFVINQDNITQWRPNVKYTKGQIVLFKNEYWSAIDLVQPSKEFNYNLWVKSDYDRIQTGMLPNAANESNQLSQSYSVYDANLESEVDLFSYGLIGFRPRDYMQALNLSDTSQVQLYQQFLGTKGTTQAAEIFTFANLGKEIAQYDIYEYWAIQQGAYGATDNNRYFELRLNEALLTSDPSVVQVIDPEQTSKADQTILVQDIWKSSFPVSSPMVLPTTTSLPTDVSLPSAGYVNLDDVDFTVFSTDDINTSNLLPTIGDGSTLWVAKVNAYDWNVYRAELIPGQITKVNNNLNGQALVTFTKAPGLSTGDKLIIKYLDPLIDGVYTVRGVTGSNTLLIDYAFVGTRSEFQGQGIGLKLQTSRVTQASDVVDLPYATSLIPGSKVWIDDNGQGLWTVLEKQQPFLKAKDITPDLQAPFSKFGTSVAQAVNNIGAMIGAPGYNLNGDPIAPGAVFTYVKFVQDNQYVQNGLMTLEVPDTVGYGSSMGFGNQTWAVVGAPDSLTDHGYVDIIKSNLLAGSFDHWQLLVRPLVDGSTKFGHDVTISRDENWLYVSAPVANKVYAYQKVDYQKQSVQYLGDGITQTFNYNQSIIINSPDQIVVDVNNNILIYGVDYVINNGNIFCNTPPVSGAPVTIFRRTGLAFNGPSSTFDLSSLYNVSDIESFSVFKNGIILRPGADFDYTFTYPNLSLTAPTSPGDLITIRSESYWRHMDTLYLPALMGGEEFGYCLSTSTDGRQVIVGGPGADGDQGLSWVFDREVQKFLVTDPSIKSYTTQNNIDGPTAVYLNGQKLLPEPGNIGGQYTVSGNTVTLSVTLTVGDLIEVDVNQFRLIQTMSSDAPSYDARYGQALDICINNCSLFVGSPADSATLPEAGKVEFYLNQSRVYGVTSNPVANAALTSSTIMDPQYLRINDIFIENTGSNVYTLANDINNANIPNVIASATNGRITISIKNANAAPVYNKLTVLPGAGNVFYDLGFDQNVYVYQQTLTAPVVQAYGHFGQTVNSSDDAATLVIGAPNGTLISPTVIDNGATTFDNTSTKFSDYITQSGVAYSYDRLLSSNPNISNPPQFVFGQQLYDSSVQSLDAYGYAIDYTTGVLLVGGPTFDGYPVGTSNPGGHVVQFLNKSKQPSWTPIHVQQPVVDISLLDTVYMYDLTDTAVKQFFDFFNPLQGRLLGAVRQNLDFIGAVDPAAYNVGTLNNYGDRWGTSRVGQIWWDTSNVRFIDPNQDDIVYASRRWGQVFPGSTIDVYQWVSSDVPPSQYTDGTPRSLSSYVIASALNDQGAFITTYFFWATGLRTINRSSKKTLSVDTIARYIEAPRSSGIPYIAPIDGSTIAIYNSLDLISAQDTILHIEFDQQLNEDAVHVQYQLIGQDRAEDFLDSSLYRKLQDSFCGSDTVGHLVPDPLLPISDRYGVAFRPRQSMFVNRFLALQNYLGRANDVLAQHPIGESGQFDLLNSHEPEPAESSGAWNKRVLNIEELSYQDLVYVPIGYRYLVVSDSNNNGLWTIYEVIDGPVDGSRDLMLVRVQNYDTRLYWSYIDWYLPGYNPLTKVALEVPNYAALATITVAEGSSVKVTANAQHKWEIYRLTDGDWVRVGLEAGTIEFLDVLWNYQIGRFGFDVEVFDAQYFDKEPVIETRKIIQAINQELLTNDLLIERNRLLILMFNYILTELNSPSWLTKTSLIEVDHLIRNLEPFQIYRVDNQDFVLKYIQEVKPYHAQIKQFNLIYDGFDQYQGSLTDFDLPAYWDAQENLFISPVLDDNPLDPMSTTSSVPSTDPIWKTFPYNQWYQNYTLSLESVTIYDSGSGYTVEPEVVVTPNNGAELVAQINSAGQVISVLILNPGTGWVTTPTIELVGGNGTGARAIPNMGNSLVRNILTVMKFDRYQYQTSVTEWQPNVVYVRGDLVRFNGITWTPLTDDSLGISSPTFDPLLWEKIDPSTLSGVDRTMGFYVPTPNEPGLDLPLLIYGVDYPGVQVKGVNFDQNTGYDVGGYDINPYDNISYGPDGRPTYDPAILDAIYESYFGTPATGQIPTGLAITDINVNGGAFVDTYSSHAPEELVPGAIFDTLDFRVFTTPGGDWLEDGHGFAIAERNYTYSPGDESYSFFNIVPYPVAIRVWNWSTGQQLNDGIDYLADWRNQNVQILGGAAPGDIIMLSAYELGGGNQLYKNYYFGTDGQESLTLPLNSSLISSLAVFKNGVLLNSPADYTFAQDFDPIGVTTTINGFLDVAYLNLSVTSTDGILIGSLVVADGYYSGQTVTYVLNDTTVQISAPPDDPTLVQGFITFKPSSDSTRITFADALSSSDYVSVTALGFTDDQALGWSTPLTQYFIADGSTTVFALENSLISTNPANIIVNVNGRRARPAAGIEYVANGSTAQYQVPTRNDVNQGDIADNQVLVYIDGQPLQIYVDYIVDPWDGSSTRTVTLSTVPATGSQILISVYTGAAYFMIGSELYWNTDVAPLDAGDIISVTTWNDPQQQNILTQVFVGPNSQGFSVSIPYDSTDFDQGPTLSQPLLPTVSFDETFGTVVQNNIFDTGRSITNSNRLEVSLNGTYIFENQGYYIDGSSVVIYGPPIGPLDVVTITSLTQSVVPEAEAFRIFQDMRGYQSTYRITDASSTTLAQGVSEDDDTIYLVDVSHLSDPNLEEGIFGQITINGERIAYRVRDISTNTISSLRRGIYGTAAADHVVGTPVYSIGIGERLPQTYQDILEVENFLADGSTTTFVATDLSVSNLDSTEITEAVLVYVGGILQQGGYTISDPGPLTVVFDDPPTQGYQVSLRIRRGLSWYQPGVNTASDGVPLQLTNTDAARFIRGE